MSKFYGFGGGSQGATVQVYGSYLVEGPRPLERLACYDEPAPVLPTICKMPPEVRGLRGVFLNGTLLMAEFRPEDGELQVESALWFIRDGAIVGWKPSWLKPEDMLVFDWEIPLL